MKKPPYRTWIGLMIFFSTFTNYILRSNMSVSVVAMVEKKGKVAVPACLKDKEATTAPTTTLATTTVTATTTAAPNTTQNTTEETHASSKNKFEWDETQVGNVLGSYFWGYLVSILFGGILAELLGPWHVIFWSSVLSTACIGLAPISAIAGGYGGMLANRFLTGFLGGPVYPAIQVLMTKWAPPKEKGKFMAALMGNTIGTVYAFVVVGQMTMLYGWEWGFYILVITMGVFCVAFFFIVADTPEKSRWVSQEERDYIAECMGSSVSKEKAVAPLLKIMTNIPFWAMTIAQFGNLWALNLILTYAPKFMSETMGFNIRDSAGLAALPYLARMFCSSAFGIVGDWMRKQQVMSVTKMRKFFLIFSHFIAAACFFVIRAAGCEAAGVVALVVLNQAFNGAVVVSHLVNPQDLTPNFAGTCYSIMNFCGMTTGFIVPALGGALNKSMGKTVETAALIYMIGGLVLAGCGVVFIIFGSAEVQPFNEIKSRDAQNSQS